MAVTQGTEPELPVGLMPGIAAQVVQGRANGWMVSGGMTQDFAAVAGRRSLPYPWLIMNVLRLRDRELVNPNVWISY
jgi:hypothetical protein